MSPIWCSLATVLVALCYLFARAHRLDHERRQRLVRRRVALLLWIVAERSGEYEPLAPSH
jgi:hypothetical protein